MMNPKIVDIKIFAAICCLVMVTFFNITNLPIPYKYNVEAVLIAVIFIIGFRILIKNYFVKKTISSHNATTKYIFLCVSLIILSAVLASLNFGQPLIFGLLASRRSLYCLTGLIIFSLLKKEIISINNLEKIFIFYFITMLAIYYMINIFFPAEALLSTADTEFTKGFVGYSESMGISRYIFDQSIIIFGLIYSLVNRKNKKFLVYLLCALFYIFFFFRGRIPIFLFIIIGAYYLIVKANLKTKITFCVFTGIVIPLSFFFGGFEQELSHLIVFFKDGFAALTGKIGSDASANARIFEAKTAWRSIEQFHYIGVGQLSNQWLLTNKLLLGYFHPSDIGLLGIWFLYGIAGVVAFFYLCLMVGKLFFIINKENIFIFSCWLYSVYILLSSLMTGGIFITAFGQFSIMLAIITYSIEKNKKYSTK